MGPILVNSGDSPTRGTIWEGGLNNQEFVRRLIGLPPDLGNLNRPVDPFAVGMPVGGQQPPAPVAPIAPPPAAPPQAPPANPNLCRTLPITPICQGPNNGCGTSSLAMVLNLYEARRGNNTNPFSREGLDALNRRWDNPTTGSQLGLIARDYGYYSEAYNDTSFVELADHIRKGHPVIAYVPGHWVVINGYTLDPDPAKWGVTVTDPASGQTTVENYDAFRQRWSNIEHGYNRFMVVISDKDDLRPSRDIPLADAAGNLGNTTANIVDRAMPFIGDAGRWVRRQNRNAEQWTERNIDRLDDWSFRQADDFERWFNRNADDFGAWRGRQADGIEAWGTRNANDARNWATRKADEVEAWGTRQVDDVNQWSRRNADDLDAWRGRQADNLERWGDRQLDAIGSIFR